MDSRRFDRLTRVLAQSGSRRTLVKGLLGLGGIAAAGSLALEDEVRAARRPTPTPKPVSCPGNQVWNGSQCVCPSGTICGSDCCTGSSQCCDNACCYGICYGEERCCPTGQFVCNGICLPPGGCCTDAECVGARCLNNTCVPYTPTNTPTNTPEPPTNTPTDTPTNTPVPPSNTPTDIPTDTPTNTATNTPTNTATNTPTDTATNTPTNTVTNTPTDTPTNTATNTATDTPTNTPVPAVVAVVFRVIDSDSCRPTAILSGFQPSTRYTLLLYLRGPDLPADGIAITTAEAATNSNGSAGPVLFFADIPKDVGYEVQVRVLGGGSSVWNPVLGTSC